VKVRVTADTGKDAAKQIRALESGVESGQGS
jgi:hypothetical protein